MNCGMSSFSYAMVALPDISFQFLIAICHSLDEKSTITNAEKEVVEKLLSVYRELKPKLENQIAQDPKIEKDDAMSVKKKKKCFVLPKAVVEKATLYYAYKIFVGMKSTETTEKIISNLLTSLSDKDKKKCKQIIQNANKLVLVEKNENSRFDEEDFVTINNDSIRIIATNIEGNVLSTLYQRIMLNAGALLYFPRENERKFLLSQESENDEKKAWKDAIRRRYEERQYQKMIQSGQNRHIKRKAMNGQREESTKPLYGVAIGWNVFATMIAVGVMTYKLAGFLNIESEDTKIILGLSTGVIIMLVEIILYILRTIELTSEEGINEQHQKRSYRPTNLRGWKKGGVEFVAPHDMPSLVGKTRPLNIGRGGISGGIGMVPPQKSSSANISDSGSREENTEVDMFMKMQAVQISREKKNQ